jgi:hypothetical protein
MRASTGGFNDYHFFQGHRVPNYLNLFQSLNPSIKLEPKSIFILKAFSEYHVKLLEQSMITYFKPEINDLNTPVSFTFGSVQIENFNPPI